MVTIKASLGSLVYCDEVLLLQCTRGPQMCHDHDHLQERRCPLFFSIGLIEWLPYAIWALKVSLGNCVQVWEVVIIIRKRRLGSCLSDWVGGHYYSRSIGSELGIVEGWRWPWNGISAISWYIVMKSLCYNISGNLRDAMTMAIFFHEEPQFWAL